MGRMRPICPIRPIRPIGPMGLGMGRASMPRGTSGRLSGQACPSRAEASLGGISTRRLVSFHVTRG